MPNSGPERRRLQRVQVKGHVKGRWINGGAHEIDGTSKDVSAEGIFFFSESEIAEGAKVELVLDLPSEHVFKGAVTLRCIGRVIRTEEDDRGQYGVAVVFENVEIVAGN